MAKLLRLAQNWSLCEPFSARDARKWSQVFYSCERTEGWTLVLSCFFGFFTLLFRIFNFFYSCISTSPFFFSIRNHFNSSTKAAVTISKIENHCYREVLAICVGKAFLRLRQIWLILMKTDIMRRSIMLEFLLFVGAVTSVCQWVSHLLSQNQEIMKLNGVSTFSCNFFYLSTLLISTFSRTMTPQRASDTLWSVFFSSEHTQFYTLAFFIHEKKKKEQNIKGTPAQTGWHTSQVTGEGNFLKVQTPGLTWGSRRGQSTCAVLYLNSLQRALLS